MAIQDQVILYAALVAAVILHEISHGVVALAFGDDTAKRAGRLTLNPIPHIDPVGSVLIPALGVLAGLPVLGWAKPVPVNPARLRNPRRHVLLVGLAGPATNFMLMALAALGARTVLASNARIGDGVSGLFDPVGDPLFLALWFFAVVNLFLGVFNMLPIPPLDGSSLVERLIPRQHLATWHRFRPYGFLVIFLGLFMFNFFSTIIDPFLDALADFVAG
ncbi:MAG: site-2 protease family protein [Actinobacteria bacterium]|nr:site-2 protease family protein [Actinomycetota bacterium]